jgi:anti-sigma-K factor RskA
MTDHARFHDDIGAYLLGALDDGERAALERHLDRCGECAEEVERLRPAAEALPGSVEQLDPPPGLKTAIMAEVVRDAAPVRRERSLPWLRFRPALALAATLLIGLAVAFGVTQLGDDDSRTVVATVDEAMPAAGGSLSIEGAEATLRLHDMPDLGERRVYQVWLQHDDRMVPARTFEVGGAGTGEVALQDVSEADGVYVTREPRGGAQVPSEDPIVSVPL